MIMLCYITNDMLYKTCHVMLYNTRYMTHVMLYNTNDYVI